MSLKIEFSDDKISPWSGFVLMKHLLSKLEMESALNNIGLPVQGSNRGHDPIQLIINFWLSVWSGASCFEHTEVTRHDEVLKDIFEWDTMPGHKSYQRYFNKFDQAKNHEVFTNLYQWFFSNLHFDNYTLDFDSSVITRYGEQEGVAKGYNPTKPGRKSHHPLIAFVADSRMISNCWNRPGNTGSANNFLSFMEDTIDNLSNKKVGLIRADSGFYSKEIFDYMENRSTPLNYIIACRFIRPLKVKMATQASWLKIDNGLEISESTYKANNWEQPRRIIMIRQKISDRPKAAGKQLKLFEDDYRWQNYRFSCFITNLSLPAKQVYDLYRGRADSENRIKELKYDYSFDSFNVNSFWANEAIMNFIMMAYNLMSLFRQVVIGTKIQNFLKTLRYKVFSIAGYIENTDKGRVLKLNLKSTRRTAFEGLWGKYQNISTPILVSLDP